MKFKVTNWAEYDAGLRRRGTMTLWVTDKAMANWQAAPRLTAGGQPYYYDLAIETGLTLRLEFHLPLRQTEGLMTSLFELMGVSLATPDHRTLSRRAMTMTSISKGCRLPGGPLHLLIDSTGLKVFGAGEWLQEKHGVRARRTWRKLHLAVDANTGMVMASTRTENDMGDTSQVAPLLDQIDAKIGSVTADGAYEGAPTYDTVAARGRHPGDHHAPCHRGTELHRHPLSLAAGPTHYLDGGEGTVGLAKGHRLRSALARRAILGPDLRARSLPGQRAEAAVGVAVLTRMLHAGRPNSVRNRNMAL